MPLAQPIRKITGRFERDLLDGLESKIGPARYSIYLSDAFDWLAQAPPCSIHAVVTDPPYGLVEYTERELEKMQSGRGGV